MEIIDDKKEKAYREQQLRREMQDACANPLTKYEEQNIKECKNKHLFKVAANYPEVTFNSYKNVCDLIASGMSPYDACQKYNMSAEQFFMFKYYNKDNVEIQELFENAFKNKGVVYIGKCEEVIQGLLDEKVKPRVAEVALNGLFKLAAIADKRFSDSPRINVDARSVTFNELNPDKIIELNRLITKDNR
jgi:hypothetical protein